MSCAFFIKFIHTSVVYVRFIVKSKFVSVQDGYNIILQPVPNNRPRFYVYNSIYIASIWVYNIIL